MGSAFVLVCGKNVYRLLGIERTPIFGISALYILLAAFFFVFYTATGYRKANLSVSVVLCSIFLLSHGKLKLIENQYLTGAVEVLMLALALYGVWKSIRQDTDIHLERKKELFKDMVVWAVCLVLLVFPVVLFYENGLEFVGKALLSGAVSFGGGDAYLSIAEAAFVDTGWIHEEVYYGQIVSVVNVLPGSVLCKTLTGIGYYVGYGMAGNIWDGVLYGMVAFVVSVVISCVIFFVVYHMYSQLSMLATIQKITRWIRPMAAGLLINVILSLCNQGMNTAWNLGIASWQVVLLLFGLAVCNLIGDRRFGLKSGWLLAADLCVGAVILC